MRVQRLEQGRGETARRSQPGAGRDVRHGSNLEASLLQAGQFQRLADNRMLDLFDGFDPFQSGILDDEFRGETVVQCDVNVFVDGRCHQEPAILFVVRRQVGAAAAEADAQG